VLLDASSVMDERIRYRVYTHESAVCHDVEALLMENSFVFDMACVSFSTFYLAICSIQRTVMIKSPFIRTKQADYFYLSTRNLAFKEIKSRLETIHRSLFIGAFCEAPIFDK